MQQPSATDLPFGNVKSRDSPAAGIWEHCDSPADLLWPILALPALWKHAGKLPCPTCSGSGCPSQRWVPARPSHCHWLGCRLLLQAVVACMAGWLLHIAQLTRIFLCLESSKTIGQEPCQTCACCLVVQEGALLSCTAEVPCRDAAISHDLVRGSASRYRRGAPHGFDKDLSKNRCTTSHQPST